MKSCAVSVGVRYKDTININMTFAVPLYVGRRFVSRISAKLDGKCQTGECLVHAQVPANHKSAPINGFAKLLPLKGLLRHIPGTGLAGVVFAEVPSPRVQLIGLTGMKLLCTNPLDSVNYSSFSILEVLPWILLATPGRASDSLPQLLLLSARTLAALLQK